MNDEKRMVDTFEVKHSILVGDKEILFGVDETKTDFPYLVCDCTWDNSLNIEQYFNAAASTDYLEMMMEFINRVHTQLDTVKAEQDKIDVPFKPFTPEHCIPINGSQDLENKVVVIRPERMRPEYRTAVNQLVLATGGFGVCPNSRGRAVFIVNLYSGKESRWNREDILGMPKPEYMPEWAKERLGRIQAERLIYRKKQEMER